MILIVAAMEEEYNELAILLENSKKANVQGVNHHLGKLEGKEVILMLSGIGKVNTAASLTTIINEYEIDFVINIGSAGGVLNQYNVKVLDIVVAKKVCYHDVDLTMANRPKGQLPGLPQYFETNVSKQMLELLDESEFDFHYATIASGDEFVGKIERITEIVNTFDDVCAIEMEAGAVAQICFQREIPFVVFRSISDVVGSDISNQMQFKEYIKKASINSAAATKLIIGTL